jgi:hypothetical protein
LKIEDFRFACGGSILKKPTKKGGAKRHPQIFNIHYSIFNFLPPCLFDNAALYKFKASESR